MDEEINYLYLKGNKNSSTVVFSKTYMNVVRVELCYADLPVKNKYESIILDIEEFRSGNTDEGIDVIASRDTNSPIRGFFMTMPVSDQEEGSRRIFRETSDYLYGINFSTPLSFTKLTTRILDQTGKQGHDDCHILVLRVISKEPPTVKRVNPQQQRPQRPVILVPQPRNLIPQTR